MLSKAEDTPFELGADVNLDTYLDYLPYTLRSDKARAIFSVQAEIVKVYRTF